MMRCTLFLLLLTGAARAADPATLLCAGNPAYAPEVMRAVLDAQLQKDHDPVLDSEPPEQMAADTAKQSVLDCAADMRAHPALQADFANLTPVDLQVAWDAYNTTCSDHAASKAECVRAEVGAADALRHMAQSNQPAGARALVQACQLVLKPDLAMVEWRICVDAGLAEHAVPGKAAACKTSVSWHMARSGAEAGSEVVRCLRR